MTNSRLEDLMERLCRRSPCNICLRSRATLLDSAWIVSISLENSVIYSKDSMDMGLSCGRMAFWTLRTEVK